MICKEAIQLIKQFESLHDGDLSTIGLQPKLCPAGIWTVGYGRALTDKTGKFLKGDAGKADAYAMYPSITESDAERMLAEDLARFEAIVSTHTKGLNQYQFGACVSLCYNIGQGNFATSSVVRFIKDKKLDAAADAFLLWNKATVNGKRVELAGLTKRRKAERELFLQ